MPRVVPTVTRFGYGGMIEGKDYTAVVNVLEQIAELIGVEETSPILTADLVDAVAKYIEKDSEISFSLGYERGYCSGVEDIDISTVVGDLNRNWRVEMDEFGASEYQRGLAEGAIQAVEDGNKLVATEGDGDTVVVSNDTTLNDPPEKPKTRSKS